MDELNLRGHFGAYAGELPTRAPTPGVALEELLTLLAMPHCEADGRLFKLIVRALQRGSFDAARLCRLARQEQAEPLLTWLLQNLPDTEHTESTRALAARLTPRGDTRVDYRYDFDRLTRRPATREQLWHRPRG